MSDVASGLVDIIEPTAPVVVAATGMCWFVIAIILTVLLVIGLMVWWRKHRTCRARIKRLQVLRHTCQANELVHHEMIGMLALELRRGLKLARLRADELPEAFQPVDIALWADFVMQLDELRYQSKKLPDKAQLNALFAQVETWLGRYCR